MLNDDEASRILDKLDALEAELAATDTTPYAFEALAALRSEILPLVESPYPLTQFPTEGSRAEKHYGFGPLQVRPHPDSQPEDPGEVWVKAIVVNSDGTPKLTLAGQGSTAQEFWKAFTAKLSAGSAPNPSKLKAPVSRCERPGPSSSNPRCAAKHPRDRTGPPPGPYLGFVL
jgi:hypothetical protein